MIEPIFFKVPGGATFKYVLSIRPEAYAAYLINS
jgi:hypothetical protein